MSDARAAQITRFCAQTKWKNAVRRPLAGDASNRRYFRLTDPVLGCAVLMDAPPEKGEDIAPFVAIATHLRHAGLSAPEIYDQDAKLGFLLLEDLGDDLIARVLDRRPELEEALYFAAIDALVAAQSVPPPEGLPVYGTSQMTKAASLAVDWYARFAGAPIPDAQRETFSRLVEDSIAPLDGPEVLVQRDYHAENLLWLPEREGPARIGLLDFQDAALGHPAYDLASLLVDVRRVVSPQTRDAGIRYYLSHTGYDAAAFNRAFSTLSAQRNLRILGVFTRLCVRDGKPNYPDMLPLVWKNLQSNLAHPALAALRRYVTSQIPAPTPQIIAAIKASYAG